MLVKLTHDVCTYVPSPFHVCYFSLILLSFFIFQSLSISVLDFRYVCSISVSKSLCFTHSLSLSLFLSSFFCLVRRFAIHPILKYFHASPTFNFLRNTVSKKQTFDIKSSFYYKISSLTKIQCHIKKLFERNNNNILLQ